MNSDGCSLSRLPSRNLPRKYHKNIIQNSQLHEKDMNQEPSGQSAVGYRYFNLIDVVVTLVNMYLSRRCQAPQ